MSKRPKFSDDPLAYLDHQMDRTYVPKDPSKLEKAKRPKPNPKNPKNGGWRGHPNSLAALEAHRARTMLGGPGLPRCEKCGTQPRVRGSKFCVRHGGSAVLAERRKKETGAYMSNYRLMGRKVFNLVTGGELPDDLARNPMFVAAYAEGRGKAIKEAVSPKLVARRRACVELSFQIIRAYYLAQKGEHELWMDCVAKARDLKLIAPH